MSEKAEKKAREIPATDEQGSELVVYELGYHIVSSTPEGSLGSTVASVHGAIESRGGVFVADEFPKETALAYEMVKVSVGKRERHTKSYFGWFKFEANPSEARAILSAVEAMPAILRAILLKTVRENTLIGKRIFVSDRMEGETIKRRDVKETPPATPISDEELDRTIERMVVE